MKSPGSEAKGAGKRNEEAMGRNEVVRVRNEGAMGLNGKK